MLLLCIGREREEWKEGMWYLLLDWLIDCMQIGLEWVETAKSLEEFVSKVEADKLLEQT